MAGAPQTTLEHDGQGVVLHRGAPESYLKAVRSSGLAEEHHLLAFGRWSSQHDGQDVERVGLLALRPGGTRVLVDAWLSEEEVVECCRHLPKVLLGSWDVMFATAWKYAWAAEPTFQVWDRRGCCVRVVGPGEIRVRRGWGGESTRRIRAIEGRLRWEGFRQEILALPVDGSPIRLARRTDLIDLALAALGADDDLGADFRTGWMEEVAQPLAEALQVEYLDPRSSE